MFGNKMNNSGWILCPSKRFPGKFYYYNVVNGESAWCFNETEKKFLSIDDKTRLVSQKWHCYPEPLSPPGKGLNCFTGSSFLLPQKFGQASFPKYFSPAAPKLDGFGAINFVPNARNPSVIKASMLGIQNVHKTLVPKKNVDIQTDLPETEVIVQSCEEPLSKRFLKYHRNESEENNLEILNGKYFESSKVFKNLTNEPQSVQSMELSQENLSLSTPNSVHNSTNSHNTNSTSKIQLADNDLRFILQAKKSEKKKDEPQKKSTVKKVRFDLTPSVNDEESIYDSEDETEIKDALNTATEKIVKHIDNTAKSDNCIGSKLHIEDDLKNIKFVVKNTNPQNMFQQKADEFNPFLFKSENITNLEKISKNQNVENSVNIINENPYHTSTPNNSYKSDDILNVTKTMKEKLHVRVPNQFGADPKILFLKSTPQENPFKKYKSKINPYLKLSPTKAFTSLPGLFASNRLDKNNFKFRFINSFKHKVVTSNKDINYFDPKLYSNNSNTGHLNNNYINQSGYAKEQTHFGYTNNSKVADGCMIFSDKNKIDNKDRWLDHKLKNFYARNSYIENTVKVRMDEIICSFTQIIENIIYEILETSTCPPPYSLYDALLSLQRKFSENTHILQVVNRITDLDIFCSKTGYLKSNVHPHELIKALGCGLVFIEALNESEEYDVKDGEDALLQLLRDIEEPEYVELPQPTTVSRDGSTEQLNRVNFIKERSEILQYLRKHFPEWENYCEEQDQTPNTNSTHNVVVTTTGKDLHLYKINSKNQIYREPEDVQETNEFKRDNECDNKKVIAKFHIIEEFENRIKVNPENETQSKYKQEIIDDVSDDEKLVIDEKTPEEFYEDDANKCSEESVVIIETTNEVNVTKPDSPRIDTSIRINESSTITDDFPVLINDPVTHISADDADEYYFLVKTFLTELSNCLLSIHAFIKDNAERMHDTDLTDDDRKEIHKNANQIYVYLKNIILELKSIVERETRNENALKILLMSADGALQDKRITNYRQVTAKCVEQARHLAGCVRLLLRATDRDCTLSASSEAGTTCINIFE